MYEGPFAPRYGSGQNVTAGAAISYPLHPDDFSVYLCNLSDTEDVYVRIINDASNATPADCLIPAGRKPVCLFKGAINNKISVFSSGAPLLYFCTGNGWLTN